MPVNFNLLRQAGPANFAEGLMQGQDQQNALLQQQQQRQLSDIQLRNALRGEQEAMAESEAVKGSASLEDLAGRYRKAGLGKQALATEAALAKQRTDKLAAAKTQTELLKTSATRIMNRPESAIQELQRYQQLTGVDMSDDIAQVQGMAPEAIKQWAAGHALEADKLLPKFQSMSVPGVGVQTGTTDFTGKFTPGQVFKEQMSEAQKAQNEIAQRRLGVEQQRLAQDATGVVYQEDANGNVIALPSRLKKGEVPTARIAVAPGGGFQPLQGKPSEAVGKEQMSINQQRAIVKGAIDAATTTPDAFGMSRGLMGETLGGRMGSSQENQARSYLFNVVSGVIKERAGTAQSAAEAETLARFLPQPTDNADTIVDKMTAFDKYLVAKETGTTKKRGGAEKPPLAPMDQEALKWANSNPADPRAAAIKQRLGM